MVGVGFTIAEATSMLIDAVVWQSMGSLILAGILMSVITAIWISKAGTNGIGVLLTGWVALLFYFTGPTIGVFPQWFGPILVIIIAVIFQIVVSKVQGG